MIEENLKQQLLLIALYSILAMLIVLAYWIGRQTTLEEIRFLYNLCPNFPYNLTTFP